MLPNYLSIKIKKIKKLTQTFEHKSNRDAEKDRVLSDSLHWCHSSGLTFKQREIQSSFFAINVLIQKVHTGYSRKNVLVLILI